MYLVVLLAFFAAVAADDKPAPSYDNVDVDAVLHNERLLTSYYKCLMDRARCSPEGLALKESLPDAIATDCGNCNKKQAEITHKIMKFIVNNKKEWYAELEDKYDPERKYRDKFRKRAED